MQPSCDFARDDTASAPRLRATPWNRARSNRAAALARLAPAMLGIALAAAPGWSAAQATFPDHPVQMIIPAGPGGSTDLIMRGLAKFAAPLLGQPIVIVNRAGASGMIGVASVVHAKPDGYTVGGVWSGPITMAPHVGPAQYALTDYKVVTMTSAASGVLCVPPAFPAHNGREFLDELRAHPDKYTYGADGVGGFVHFATEHIFNSAGIRQRMIPFSGTGQTVTAFMGGTVDIYGGAIAPILPFARDGKAKCLLVTSAKRFAVLPDVDSLSDVGLAQAQTVLWHGVIAPAGVPAQVMAKLADAFRRAAQDPEFKRFAEAQGEEPWITDTETATRYARDEFAAMGQLAGKIDMGRSDKDQPGKDKTR